MKLKYFTVVQKQSFGTLRKYEKIDRKRPPKVIKNDLKWTPRATSGSIFEIFSLPLVSMTWLLSDICGTVTTCF